MFTNIHVNDDSLNVNNNSNVDYNEKILKRRKRKALCATLLSLFLLLGGMVLYVYTMMIMIVISKCRR